jgi:4-diphosphocytidyl-2-C-methyl-D-erythritol kinase
MPATVTERARAKVNLVLRVLGRRADGYHELDSLVAFADIADRLRFERADRLELAVSGRFAAAVPEGGDNLVLKAALAFYGLLPGRSHAARIELEKNLPVAAGLGGGSADAAAALRGLARLHDVALSPADLHDLAAGIGSDVPVCLRSQASFMRGSGEIVEPVADFRPRHAILVHPGAGLRTAAVFRELGLAAGSAARANAGLDECRNDLTDAAMRLEPVIGEVLKELHRQPGLELARMSGSGTACFGLFASAEAAEESSMRIARAHPGWWCRATVLT